MFRPEMALVAFLAMAGCGDDPPPPPVGLDAGPREDSGPVDARTPDAPSDAGNTSILPTSCEIVGDHLIGTVAARHRVNVAIAGGADAFMIAWTNEVAGTATVTARRLTTSGELADETMLASGTITATPALLATPSGWLAAWARTEGADPFVLDLEAAGLDAAGAPGAVSVVAADGVRNQLPTLASIRTGTVVAWIRHDLAMSTPPAALARPIDEAGALAGSPFSLSPDGQSVSRVAVSDLREQLVAVWLDIGATDTRTLSRVFSAGGETLGPVQTLSMEPLGGSLSLASSMFGASTVFDVLTGPGRYDSHVRHIDLAGETLGPERRITVDAPGGRAPSVVRFPIMVSGGICGSVLLSTAWAPTLSTYRISLIDPDDVAIHTTDVPADPGDWPVAIMALADDGTAAVVRTDGGGSDVRVSLVQCR